VTFEVLIKDVRPSGHKFVAYRATFSCEKAAEHKRDILAFLEQLERECPEHMKDPRKEAS
jgi:hypothetical protein